MNTGAAQATDVRCFVALRPDAAGVRALARVRSALEGASAGAAHGVRWVDAATLHLTLRFLGDATPAQVAYFRHLLPALARRLPPLVTRRCCVWPNRARPRLLVVELEAHAVLDTLAAECEAYARKAGFEPETRGFRPHLTLARLRPGCAFGILPEPSITLGFERVALLQSTLAHPAAVYTELAGAALG